jgi:hypothetical protein
MTTTVIEHGVRVKTTDRVTFCSNSQTHVFRFFTCLILYNNLFVALSSSSQTHLLTQCRQICLALRYQTSKGPQPLLRLSRALIKNFRSLGEFDDRRTVLMLLI